MVVLASALFLSRQSSESLPSAAVRDWSRIASGRLHLEMRTKIPAAVSGFFLERALPFRVEPGTLALPGYQLVGARVHSIGGRTSALAVHRDRRNRIVICQRFEGRVEELPRPDRVVVRGAGEVRLYRSRRGGAIFWQEGGVIRSLASDVSDRELERLAFSDSGFRTPACPSPGAKKHRNREVQRGPRVPPNPRRRARRSDVNASSGTGIRCLSSPRCLVRGSR